MRPDSATESPSLASARSRRLAWIGWAAAALLLVAFRLHAFDLPLETDECNYAYIGGRLLDGDRLYLDVWDHQPPGVFVLFAGVIALFGDAPEVFRWMATVFSLASLLLLFLMIRRVASPGAAVCGALLFALASSDPDSAGEGCNREIYMNTLILAAWYLALRRAAGPTSMIFLSGCALALASSIKTVVAIHWLLLAVGVAISARRGPLLQGRVRSVTASLALFAAGPAILWVTTLCYFFATDRLAEFVDAVFRFNLSYSGGSEAWWARFLRFFAPPRHPFIFDSALPLWLGGIGAAAWLLVEIIVRRSHRALAIFLLLPAGFISVCLPGRFWPHYYHLLIPPLVVAVSMGIGEVIAQMQGRVQSRRLCDGWTALFAVFPAWLFATEYRDYLSQPPFGITVKRYNSRDFWGRAQGENVQRVTDPDDEIFVFGNDAEIYYYARRRCASRFTMITGVQAQYAGADERRALLMDELKAHPPRLIMVLFDEKPFPEWKEFLEEHYGEPVGWDYHDRTREPIMFVLARKDQPVESINWNWDRSQVGGWLPGRKP